VQTRRSLPLLGGALAAAVSLSSCAGSNNDLAADVTDDIGTSAQLDLATRTDQPWDTVTVVCPYESASDVEARLGTSAAGIPDLSRSDDRQVIVFLSSGRIASTDSTGRGGVDLCGSGTWPVLTAETSTIALHASDTGWVATPPA
jgi:hypothetical protein